MENNYKKGGHGREKNDTRKQKGDLNSGYSAAWKEQMKMTDLVDIVGRGLMFRGITTAAVQLR